VVRQMYEDAAKLDQTSERQELARWASKSESHRSLKAMVDLVKSEPGVSISPNVLDNDPWLLNVKNGTIDLRTGELKPHDPDDMITKLAPVEYDPEARAGIFEAFLERILPSEDMRTFVQRAVGYSLTGDVSERVFFILHGLGKNGKSTLLEAVKAVLGDHAMTTPVETLLLKTGGVPNDIARLKGARFVSASENEKGRRLAESLVKAMTGKDTISARFMRGEWFDFKPTHKLWLATNHKPEIQGTDPAIWDRIRLIPFDIRIPEEEQDKHLDERLLAELPGILAWAVRGCLEWRQEGLGEPDAVRKATAAYKAEMDVIQDFIDECCVEDEGAWATVSALHKEYVEWCVKNAEKPEKKRPFARQLVDRGFEADYGTGNVAIRRGIGLKDTGREVYTP
jgi:putative DNA primase/helicase